MNNRQFHKSLLLSCLLAVSGIALSGAADAVCTRANAVGTWYAMGVSGDGYFGEMGETDRCKLVVNSNGRIVASGSSCVYRDARGQSNFQSYRWLDQRDISLCRGRKHQRLRCRILRIIRIQYAQMARDKNTFSMVGYLDIDPDVVFSFKAVKQ